LLQVQEAAPTLEQAPLSKPQYDDELARTAGEIISSVSYDENPKFKNSQFMSLMRQLRDHDIVVEGNDMVPQSEATRCLGDVKGKGKAVDFAHPPTTIPSSSTAESMEYKWAGQQHALQPDPNEAYFGAENAEYAAYWDAHHSTPQQRLATAEDSRWDQLQRDWEAFETTSAGVRPIAAGYAFQMNNPYLLGERSFAQTRHHSTHEARPHSFFEVRPVRFFAAAGF
jgi:peroxin-5